MYDSYVIEPPDDFGFTSEILRFFGHFVELGAAASLIVTVWVEGGLSLFGKV